MVLGCEPGGLLLESSSLRHCDKLGPPFFQFYPAAPWFLVLAGRKVGWAGTMVPETKWKADFTSVLQLWVGPGDLPAVHIWVIGSSAQCRLVLPTISLHAERTQRDYQMRPEGQIPVTFPICILPFHPWKQIANFTLGGNGRSWKI